MRRVALLALVLGAVGCASEDDRVYTYFQVAVKIDQASVPFELMQLVHYCSAQAETPRGEGGIDLPCRRGNIPYDLGTFEYSTTLTQGQLTIKAVLSDINVKPLAEGDTGPLNIIAGKTIDAAILIKGLPGALPPVVP
jgi:hypothetical protein